MEVIVAIINLFSKRQKQMRGEVSDVFIYDVLPENLKVQIIYIIEDIFGNDKKYYENSSSNLTYEMIVDFLCREYGTFVLGKANNYNRKYNEELFEYFLNERDVEKSLDVVELTFKFIDKLGRDYSRFKKRDEQIDDAIEELNKRFKENGVGFQFIENEIIRIDSEFIHQEAVKPALKLLHTLGFEGAKDEFLQAFEHYRKGNNKEAINECLKAFESTMKTICIENKWNFPPNATSNALIKLCLDKQLIPIFWEQNLTSLRSLMESTIATGRNKLAAHGQGKEIVEVPNHLVAYILHMTASTIVFLIEANNYK